MWRKSPHVHLKNVDFWLFNTFFTWNNCLIFMILTKINFDIKIMIFCNICRYFIYVNIRLIIWSFVVILVHFTKSILRWTSCIKFYFTASYFFCNKIFEGSQILYGKDRQNDFVLTSILNQGLLVPWGLLKILELRSLSEFHDISIVLNLYKFTPTLRSFKLKLFFGF